MRAKCDDDHDATDLLEEVILTNYISIRDGKIISLSILYTSPNDGYICAQNVGSIPMSWRTSYPAAAAVLAERDPVMASLVAAAGPMRLGKPQDTHFATLVQSIVYQQLAGRAAAAAAIHGRLITALDERVEPKTVLALTDEQMRTAASPPTRRHLFGTWLPRSSTAPSSSSRGLSRLKGTRSEERLASSRTWLRARRLTAAYLRKRCPSVARADCGRRSGAPQAARAPRPLRITDDTPEAS